MKKIICVVICLCLFIFFTFPESVMPKKAAKVGNEIILVSDVEKNVKLYNIKYDEALNNLTEESILYFGAKMNCEEPKDEVTQTQIRSDKAFYANKVNKDLKDVSDEEFVSALLSNNVSMKTYKDVVKRTLWINKYVKESVDKEKSKLFSPTEKEIANLIETKPEIFEEKEGLLLSMIYFSYYNPNGQIKTEEQIKNLKIKADICLSELIKGEDFTKMVVSYTDDLISINTLPKGRVGVISFDDPRVLRSFSEEIVDALKKADVGIIKKGFQTKNGYYIFNIEEKIKPKKLSKDETRLKAETYLQKQYNLNISQLARDRSIKNLRNVVEVVKY